jgi:hypothetical protein
VLITSFCISSKNERDVSTFLGKEHGGNWEFLVELKWYVGILEGNRGKEIGKDCRDQNSVCDSAVEEDMVLRG